MAHPHFELTPLQFGPNPSSPPTHFPPCTFFKSQLPIHISSCPLSSQFAQSFPPLIFPHANFQFTIDPQPSSTSNWPLLSPHPHTPRQFSKLHYHPLPAIDHFTHPHIFSHQMAIYQMQFIVFFKFVHYFFAPFYLITLDMCISLNKNLSFYTFDDYVLFFYCIACQGSFKILLIIIIFIVGELTNIVFKINSFFVLLSFMCLYNIYFEHLIVTVEN
ncbi:uncharacterized protein Gasu_64890 [Galdieria sulphuraria]|uniref:Transmembrane protein n=1 Tax=Galdieria sulphuraria TaxID=130081 RepID=M2VRY4_GALSU|nr:uncharacterized protein Gasu_64890 [Galdieria sulphuraria]EME25851.1 hypothetical protein Gasu_64890 [Galdieria sulphuraria]|eukprot:XP_005702371.1 hypothetical protein Gasu_64890 [Galdieria sulphuraria]